MLVLLLASNIAVVEMPPEELMCGRTEPQWLVRREGFPDFLAVRLEYEPQALAVRAVPWRSLRIFCDGLETNEG